MDFKTMCVHMIPYMLICLIPFTWYMVLRNHSYIHISFTYRALSVAVFSFLCMGAAAGDEGRRTDYKSRLHRIKWRLIVNNIVEKKNKSYSRPTEETSSLDIGRGGLYFDYLICHHVAPIPEYDWGFERNVLSQSVALNHYTDNQSPYGIINQTDGITSFSIYDEPDRPRPSS